MKNHLGKYWWNYYFIEILEPFLKWIAGVVSVCSYAPTEIRTYTIEGHYRLAIRISPRMIRHFFL